MKPRTKSILTICFVVICQCIVRGQQTPLYPEYNYNPFIVNPAYTGMTQGAVLNLSHGRHIKNMEGAPLSSSLSVHAPLLEGKMGIGAAVVHDRVGVTTVTNATLAYSYKLFFESRNNRHYWEMYEQHLLSFGLTAGMKHLYENLLSLGVEGDPTFAGNVAETMPVIGAGFMYNNGGLFVGASMPNLLGNKLASGHELNISNPAYGYLGYRFFTDFYKQTMVTPSVLVKHERGAPMQVDLNLTAVFKNKFEIGAGYRSASALNAMVGFFPVEQLRIVYHYTMGLNRPVMGNHHGLVVSYAFGY